VTSGAQTSGCFLCTKPGENKDDENLILYRSATAFVLLNLYPYNSGHLLIAPFQHIGDFAALPRAVAADLITLAQRCTGILEETYHPDGFNLGMNLGAAAGAGEPEHLHMHLVPRWQGDTNFMPIVGETKVLPETLQQTYERLQPLFHITA